MWYRLVCIGIQKGIHNRIISRFGLGALDPREEVRESICRRVYTYVCCVLCHIYIYIYIYICFYLDMLILDACFRQRCRISHFCSWMMMGVSATIDERNITVENSFTIVYLYMYIGFVFTAGDANKRFTTFHMHAYIYIYIYISIDISLNRVFLIRPMNSMIHRMFVIRFRTWVDDRACFRHLYHLPYLTPSSSSFSLSLSSSLSLPSL